MKYKIGDRVLVKMEPLPYPIEYVVSSVWPKTKEYILTASNLPGSTFDVIAVEEDKIIKKLSGYEDLF